MRRTIAILVAIMMLVPAGAVVAQSVPTLFNGRRDLRAEYLDNTGPTSDPNGLPPVSSTNPSLILDSKVVLPTGVSGSSYANEAFVGLVFADPSGNRSKNFLYPGIVTFSAWYGNFTDIDGDAAIDATSDASDEWTGWDSSKVTTNEGMVAFIEPDNFLSFGYHPPVTDEYWIFAGYGFDWFDALLTAEGAPDRHRTKDFSYTGGAGGNWSAAFLIPTLDGSLISDLQVSTIVNGFVTADTDPGYSCGPDAEPLPNCRIDEDHYAVVNEQLSTLFFATLDDANTAANDTVNVACGIAGCDALIDQVDEATQPIIDILNSAPDPLAPFLGDYNESNSEDPYASMTPEHGVPRASTGGSYAFQTAQHAYLDISLLQQVADPAGGKVGLNSGGVHMPKLDLTGAAGIAPFTYGIVADTGTWYDANSNFDIDDGEFQGTYSVYDNVTGLKINLTATASAVDEQGNPVPWGLTGVYFFSEEDAVTLDPIPVGPLTVFPNGFSPVFVDEAVLDLTDLQVNNLKQEGPVTLHFEPDTSSDGQWFAIEQIFMPAGTFGFNLRIESGPNAFVRLGATPSQPAINEQILDIDLYRDWGEQLE